MNEILIKEKASKAMGLISMCLVMILASIINIYFGISEMRLYILITGLTGIVLFGYVMIYIVNRSLYALKNPDDSFLIKINEDGITDNSSKMSFGLVTWDEIDSARVTRIIRQKYVTLDLKDENEFFLSRSIKKSLSFKMNTKLNFGAVNLNLQTAEESTEELLVIINERLNLYGE